MHVRFVTYNIHRAIGATRRPDIRAVAQVLRALEPDVVGVNEIVRTPLIADQPALLASVLGMRHVFGRTARSHGMAFGNAVLVRGRVGRAWNLPLAGGEPRALLLADIEASGERFMFGATHLAPKPGERAAQLRELTSALAEMRVGANGAAPFVLAGDLNAQPRALSPLSEFLEPAPAQLTYPASDPRAAIDHVFFSRHWRCLRTFSVTAPASDHAAFVADLELVATPRRRQSSVY